ncbi:MAG: hypothetical protein QOH64_3138 [Acidimicrobiaceae bacterium]|jgi:hypothetical protein
MAAQWIRRIVIALSALGVAGMITASITNHIGLAITSGMVAAIAVLCLILVTAAAGPAAFAAPPPVDESAAADLERRVQHLVDGGAEESEVRSLLRAAARFYRRSP